jgi:hypothetical protein
MQPEHWIAAGVLFVALVILGAWNLAASRFLRATAKQPWVQREPAEMLNSNEMSAQWLLDRISTAHRMRIVSGSLHPDV